MGHGISHTDKISRMLEVKESKEEMENMSVKPETICTFSLQHHICLIL
jgi:hypothetical protein